MSPIFLSSIFLAIVIVGRLQASGSDPLCFRLQASSSPLVFHPISCPEANGGKEALQVSSLKKAVITRRPQGCGECGLAIEQKAKLPLIVDGKVVRPRNKYPWVVGLVEEGKSERFCGGSIISEKFIVTAAHCLRIKEATIHKDMGGDLCKTDKGIENCLLKPDELNILFMDDSRAAVEKVYTLPDYFAHKPHVEDVALIQLQKPIQCDNFKRTICLPESGHELKQDAGTKMIITGFGVQNTHTMEGTEDLRELQGTVVDSAQCKEFGWMPDHDNKAYCISTKGHGSPCFGDSGSNLFTPQGGKYIIYGVATAVYSTTCSPNTPSLFTALAPYLDWIHGIMNGVQ